MIHDDVDRILANDDEIVPSSGFLRSVMQAVEREAAAPRPLEFPWLRALPAFLATIAALATAVWNGIVALSDPESAAAFDEQVRQIALFAASVDLQWIMLAVVITVVSGMLPLRLILARATE